MNLSITTITIQALGRHYTKHCMGDRVDHHCVGLKLEMESFLDLRWFVRQARRFREKMKAAQSHDKSYAYKDLEFKVGDYVFLKVFPI